MPVVKNNSKAYGYNYASLSDIVNAGFTIPAMRIKPTEYGEFVEYIDDKGEWQTGAKIVVPEMKGSNDAQKYGSALTYARRYTVQMALGLACADDDKIETQTAEQKADNERYNASRPSFDDIRAKLDTLKTQTEVNAYAKEVGKAYPNPTEKQRYHINTMFSARREQLTAERRTYHESN